MKHVQTLNTRKLQNTVKKGGCGECQTSCQSACKTSCTVGKQTSEQCQYVSVCTKKDHQRDRSHCGRSFVAFRIRKELILH